jgi:O-antigen/teichoic acid export membrane protein
MSIKKNYLYSVIYQIFNILIPLITAPYISRVLGAEGIGTVSYAHSIALYFGMFGMLGLNNYGNRTIAANRNDKNNISKIFWNIYTLQVITTSIMLIAYIIFVSAFFKENKVIAYLQILYLISTVLDINWFFFGMEQFKITVSEVY